MLGFFLIRMVPTVGSPKQSISCQFLNETKDFLRLFSHHVSSPAPERGSPSRSKAAHIGNGRNGGLEHEFYFSIQLGMSSSQLTNSLHHFSEGLAATTNQTLLTIINHH